MDDFLAKAVPSAIADKARQGRKNESPQSSPARIFDWIKAAPMGGSGVLVKRYGPLAVLTACLCGVAWLGWSHVRRPALTPPSAETNLLAQKTTQESHPQTAGVEAKRAAQNLNSEEVSAREPAKPGFEAAKNEPGSGIAEAAGKTSRLPPKPVEKPAKGGETLDLIGLKIAALLAADRVVDHSVSATPVARKHEQRARGDAFDPSKHPNAPGAPRTLGTIRWTTPANKSSAEYASGEPAN
jgi:hypothetical protein